jgi:hypothetical protein
MQYTFYIRDKHYDDNIHRVVYDHHDKSIVIVDHDDPTYEIAAREFGYKIDSQCLIFRELIRDRGIVEALTSIKVFPGSILIRIAFAWAKTVALYYDERVKHDAEFATGEPLTAVAIIDKSLEYLEKYISPSFDPPLDFEDWSAEIDIGELIPAREIGVMYENIPERDVVSFHAFGAVEFAARACGWFLPLGHAANKSNEVEEEAWKSVKSTFAALKALDGELLLSDPSSDLKSLFKSAANFERMLRMAAKITKEPQKEL